MHATTTAAALSGIHNIRDLGGHPLPGGGMTRSGVFLRGDALRGLDTAGLRALLDGGLVRILDLRSDMEVAEGPNPLAGHEVIGYRHLPIYNGLATIDAMTKTHPDGFDMGLRYRAALGDCREAFAAALSHLAEAEEGATLFHCTAGKDRTGLVAALLLLNAGVEREDVVADYAATATHGAGLIDTLREKARARGSDPAHAERVLGSRPETMRATLDWLEQAHGGATAYMRTIGLPDETVSRLRTRLGG
ncbi:tyrosine-protein phosphatase [Pseudooceanicola nanhaiensis]|uniref:tyrosine-protein phosphatase n=1 Tax=Pseudooceanicola nanhaiensis TaxID=375761 RepID=UPI004059259D